LYIDGSAISLENKGVGRYSYELSRRVADRLGGGWEIDIIVYTDNVPAGLKENRKVNIIKIPAMSDLQHNLWWLPQHIKKRKYDLLLKPMESSGIKYGVPTVTVCHDVQELIDRAAGLQPLPHRMLINYIKAKFKSINLRNSDAVVCNSIFTRNAAASWYKFDAAKSIIGYCGVDDRFFESSDGFRVGNKNKQLNLSGFILTFATGDARENHSLLPELLSKMRMHGCNSKLVIAGIRERGDYVKLVESRLRELKFQPDVDYQFIGFIGEERLDDLVELYTAADFYLELSGHEGFGMQLAEAMACGTTCISSGSGALTEVGAGFDIRLSSFDPDHIAGTMVNSYNDKLHMRDNRNQIDYVRTHYAWDSVANSVVGKILSLSCHIE
jgi:glycosyltransferase involved in cell wall biosynthesis